MKTLLIDNGSTLTDKLAALSPGVEDIIRYDAIPKNLDTYSLIILSGSSEFPVVGNENKLQKEITLIQNTNIPIVGVCLGHELIAHAFGATLTHLPNKHTGMTQVKVVTSHPMFCERDNFTVYENHQYGVTDSGANLETLATADSCVAILKHVQKNIYGFQFHPEHHTDEQFGDEVFLTLFHHLMSKNKSPVWNSLKT